jgi:putative pyruvate formate lyase activating enzyme
VSLPRTTYINILAQYRVEHKAFEYPEIARGSTVKEFTEAMDCPIRYGLMSVDPKSRELREFYRGRAG